MEEYIMAEHDITGLNNKINNGGVTNQGRLGASEFNLLVDAVIENQEIVENHEERIDLIEREGLEYIETTWSELMSLRDTMNLRKGALYRITDFVTTVANDPEARSAGHPFDIIVLAIDSGRLSERAWAIQHEGDGYFDDSNLDAWQIWYSLDNDTNRFQWADPDNGKGVIYRMIDEHGNDCPYDFKNVQFKRYLTGGSYIETWMGKYDYGFYPDSMWNPELYGGKYYLIPNPEIYYGGLFENFKLESIPEDYIWVYTFAKVSKDYSVISDLSLEVNKVINNIMGYHYETKTIDDRTFSFRVLNNNVFISREGRTITDGVDGVPKESLFLDNYIGNYSYYITFYDFAVSSKIGINCNTILVYDCMTIEVGDFGNCLILGQSQLSYLGAFCVNSYLDVCSYIKIGGYLYGSSLFYVQSGKLGIGNTDVYVSSVRGLETGDMCDTFAIGHISSDASTVCMEYGGDPYSDIKIGNFCSGIFINWMEIGDNDEENLSISSSIHIGSGVQMMQIYNSVAVDINNSRECAIQGFIDCTLENCSGLFIYDMKDRHFGEENSIFNHSTFNQVYILNYNINDKTSEEPPLLRYERVNVCGNFADIDFNTFKNTLSVATDDTKNWNLGVNSKGELKLWNPADPLIEYKNFTLDFGQNEETIQIANLEDNTLTLSNVIVNNVSELYITSGAVIKQQIDLANVAGYTIAPKSFATFDIIRKGTGIASVGLKFKIQ